MDNPPKEYIEVSVYPPRAMYFNTVDLIRLFGNYTGWIKEIGLHSETFLHLKNGVIHNEKGPAIFYADGTIGKYWLDGDPVDEIEWYSRRSKNGALYYGE